MKSILKLLALFLLLSEITFPQISKTDTVRIYFQQDQFKINADGKKLLKNLKKNSDSYQSVVINGRASEEGETDYNQKLSEKRNKSVYDYLKGLKFTIPISKNDFGETHSVNALKEQDKYTANRMVEIILCKKPTDQELMDDFFVDNEPPASEYEFDPAEGIRILSSSNLYIYVPPYAFQYANGHTPSGKIKLQLKQVKSIEEMILSGMHTQSDEGPLQTAGMFDVKAFKGKQPLQLKPNSEITFQVPADSVYNDMRIFQLKDSLNEWNADWNGARLKPVNYKFNYELFFKKNLTLSEKEEMNKNISVLKYERRKMLDVLLGGLIRIKDQDKVNRLINLFSVQTINYSFSDFADAKSNGNFLFERKTQRVLNFNDVQFADVDFSQINSVMTTINDSSLSWTSLPDTINLKDGILKYYDVKMSRLMLINCDRFYDQPNKTDMVVSIDDVKNSRTYLIIPSIRGVLPGNFIENNKVKFKNIPKNEQVIVFAMGVKNGKWYYAKKEVKISGAEEKLNWIQADRKQIKNEMKNI